MSSERVKSHLTLKDTRDGSRKKGGPQQLDLPEVVRRILEMNRVDGRPTTTWKDLPDVGQEKIPAGTWDEVVVTHVEDPWDFFVVMRREADYSLAHPGWTKFFPPFADGIEALRGLPKLLGMYHQLASQLSRPFGGVKTETPFKFGDLVTVKLRPVTTSETGGEPFKGELQFQRAFVVGSWGPDPTPPKYEVYLLDTGHQMKLDGNCVLPLPQPFNFIGAMAVKASLFGVSPVGSHWNKAGKEFFQESVDNQKETQAVFTIEIVSRVENEPLVPCADYPLLVNLEARKYVPIPANLVSKNTAAVQAVPSNFATALIKKGLGIGWNLFPARPKLMAGSLPIDNKPPKLQIHLSQGILLTKSYPSIHYPLSKEVLKTEVTKLLHLREKEFVAIRGVDHHLAIGIKVEDPKELEAYGKPCLLLEKFSEEAQPEEGEDIQPGEGEEAKPGEGEDTQPGEGEGAQPGEGEAMDIWKGNESSE